MFAATQKRSKVVSLMKNVNVSKEVSLYISPSFNKKENTEN